MSSRILRDGLLDSETVSALHDRTFRLYIHLMLAADDFGLTAIGFGPIKRAAPLADWNREIIAKMLGELTDAGLILPYEVDGKQYAAIAKWKSAINCLSPKHPIPLFGMHHVLTPYRYKSKEVREASRKLLNHINGISLDGDTPVTHQRVTSSAPVPEGVRGKGKTIRPNKYSDDDFSLADFMFTKILEINSEAKKPDLEKWASEIRLMREKDNRDLKTIREVFIWANSDSFWRANILSPVKLREQFDRLVIQRSSKGNAGHSTADPSKNFVGAI